MFRGGYKIEKKDTVNNIQVKVYIATTVNQRDVHKHEPLS